jgi:NSS family neurotransmitter:Na+ symporter
MDDSARTKGQWSNRLGFVLAAAGSAIVLGNIWRFPYLVGKNGSAVFLLVYLLIVFLVGLPLLLAELSVAARPARRRSRPFARSMCIRTGR